MSYFLLYLFIGLVVTGYMHQKLSKQIEELNEDYTLLQRFLGNVIVVLFWPYMLGILISNKW